MCESETIPFTDSVIELTQGRFCERGSQSIHRAQLYSNDSRPLLDIRQRMQTRRSPPLHLHLLRRDGITDIQRMPWRHVRRRGWVGDLVADGLELAAAVEVYGVAGALDLQTAISQYS